MTNLISNAIKFTQEGEVTINWHYDPSQKVLLFECIDSGVGINPIDAERIFHPFQQADNSTARKFGGTGLGLTICKQLIDKMSGEIGAYAMKGGQSGTCFWFQIPVEITHLDEIEDAAQISTLSLAPLKNCKILVAEDNLVNQKIIMVFFSQVEANITFAADGAIALEQFKSSADFDIVLMDCQMPVMDGYQASIEIKKINPSVPIIAITANSFEEEKQQCRDAGMTGFVSKPLDKELLYRTIIQMIETSN